MKPPTPAELESDKALVTARFDEAQEILDTLKAETGQLKESQEKQRQKVEKALQSVETTINGLKESRDKREADLRGFKADIEAIKESISKVCIVGISGNELTFKALERNRKTQAAQLEDLQNELKSLKLLFPNRTTQRSFSPNAEIPSSTSTPTLTNTTSGSGPLGEALNAVNLSGAETPTSTTGGVSSYLPSRPGIPAWQLVQQAAKGAEENTQGS